MSLDFERARFNMIEQQVRPWEVLDPRVLAVMAAVRREDFTPPRYRKMAFADVAIPLDHGQVMMKPVVEGRMLQALVIKPEDAVLEIGTGSGFITACLAQLAREVVSVDQHADFVERAKSRIGESSLRNVAIEVGDAMVDWEPRGQFDVICVTGAVHKIPDRFISWLAGGGRMFVIAGSAPAMEAMLLTRLPGGAIARDSLFETDIPYLTNAAPAQRFVL